MRVLHVLHRSVPALSGYEIRTAYITRFQRDNGIEPFGVTSAQHPFDDVMEETVQGTTFMRTRPLTGPLYPGVRELRLMRALQKRVRAAIKRWKPDIVHAHSPVLVGLPAIIEAKRAGLPFVYEIRDLWENASVDRGKFAHDSAPYKVARRIETEVFRRANAVVAICQALRDELAPRVGPNTALHIVGNGVDTDRFVPVEPDDEVRARWGLQGKRVLGYLGTFQPYEGLATLIDAIPAIVANVPTAHVVITGGDSPELEERAARLGVSQHLTLTGRVPHDQVQGIYSIAEMMAYPRNLTRTTALTTPLKPLEAMAMARPVLVSDVGAMLELVVPGETGLVFRSGDADHLAEQAVAVLGDPDRARQLGAAARAWVERERQWPHLVAKYTEIYRDAAERRGR